MAFAHKSVLLEETLDALRVTPGGVYVDGTVGGGGHAYGVLERLQGRGRLIAMDQDQDAIQAAAKRLSLFSGQVELVHANYCTMGEELEKLQIGKVEGILLDLGVSSYQIDTAERGFSYMAVEAPLDMRMDQSQGLTAEEIVNTWSEERIAEILKVYGEERFAKAIARGIARARERAAIRQAGELVDIIRGSIPAKYRLAASHPAKRTFQALRIALNRELEVLESSLDGMIGLLAPGGRLCVITFHSLEDRIVKNRFRENEDPCTCPREFPVCVCHRQPKGKVVTRKPVLPGEAEVLENPRSKSAKLRVFERAES